MIKIIKRIFQVILFLVIFMIVLNIADSELEPETQATLQISLSSTEQEEKQCAAALGLFVNEQLDFEVEGRKLLSQIQSTPIELLTEQNQVTIPSISNTIREQEKCEGVCEYSKEEKDRLKNELLKQSIILTRFKKIIEGDTLSCHHPFLLFKFPILSFFQMSKQQIIEYQILAQEGKVKEAQDGLIKMNQFFENTLLNENKYTQITSLILVNTLNNVRKVLSSLPTFNHATIIFKAISYEDVIKRVEVGELQAGNALLSFPMTRKFFEPTIINETPEVKKPSPVAQFLDQILNKGLNYFFLKNETVNDHLQALKVAAWHPCIGQADIPCDAKTPNPFTWARNPMGKLITQVIHTNSPSYFRKLRNNINELSITTYNSALHKK